MRILLLLNPEIYQALKSVIMNNRVHYFHYLGLSSFYRIKAMSLITADHLQWTSSFDRTCFVSVLNDINQI